MCFVSEENDSEEFPSGEKGAKKCDKKLSYQIIRLLSSRLRWVRAAKRFSFNFKKHLTWMVQGILR
jgi:hypothetical protein